MKHVLFKCTPIFTGLICGLFLLTACVTSGPVPEHRLEERAMARWDALLGGDLAGAYEYLSPATRSSIGSLQYQRSLLLQRVGWTGAEYVEESCEETICKVKISLGFVLRGALPGVRSFEDSQLVEESWILTGGVWYFVPAK